MTVTTKPMASAVNPSVPVKSRSLWQEAMQRLMRNRAAMSGGIIIILLILTALLADVIAPLYF